MDRSAVPGVGAGSPADARFALVEGGVAAVAGTGSGAVPAAGAVPGARGGKVARLDRRQGPADPAGDDVPCDRGDAIGGEAELLEDRAGGRRSPEMIERDDGALVAH